MAVMGADQHIDWQAAAASALDWWAAAGVDTLVEETPRAWLAESHAVAAAVGAPVAEPAPPPAAALPETLDAFEAWRVGPEAPEAGWPGRPIAACGDPAADLAILIDMPESDDTEALLSGPAGMLFDRMLSAIGRDRSSIYLAPLSAVRPFGRRIPPDVATRLAGIARHRLALTRPRRLLLMGDAASRALLGMSAPAARGRLHAVNHEGGETEAVATFAPAMLLQRPQNKADAWKDLQRVIGGLS